MGNQISTKVIIAVGTSWIILKTIHDMSDEKKALSEKVQELEKIVRKHEHAEAENEELKRKNLKMKEAIEQVIVITQGRGRLIEQMGANLAAQPTSGTQHMLHML